MAVREIVVLGAGVVGLTTAIRLQETGDFDVTIIADTLPFDPKSPAYTSHWGGVVHMSFAKDNVTQQKLDKETFDVMWEEYTSGGLAESCFLSVVQKVYATKGTAEDSALGLTEMPDFRYISESELPPGATCGASFTTLTINPAFYLHYLHTRFLARGGSVVRANVQHINQVLEGGARVFQNTAGRPHVVDAVVVCTGIGSRALGGIEDKDVFPIRGQTVLLRAPWIREASCIDVPEDPELYTYMIPRPGGNVLIGGTIGVNDWFQKPRPETTKFMLERALRLCPQLAGPDLPAGHTPSVEELYPNVVEEGCGLRPARKGGIRLGVDWFPVKDQRQKVPVLYNYGHGGYGFQSSWGCASVVLAHLRGLRGKV